MLGPAWFHVDDRLVQPFAVAPWANDVGPQHEALPPLLKRLRGEWPCVPFGMPDSRENLPPAWASGIPNREDDADPHPHGYSSNAHWELNRLEPDRIELVLEYPKDHPIERLTRTICASKTSAVLVIALKVQARKAVDLPIGLHAVLYLPQACGGAHLTFSGDVQAWTLPVPLEPGISRLKPDVQGIALTRVPCIAAGEQSETEDLTRLPLSQGTEELVLVVGTQGHAQLVHTAECHAIDLTWDPKVFPACLLWLSNRGRDSYPWNCRFLAVGIEPIRSAFDLGTAVSRHQSNPLWRAAVPCTYSFSPEHPLETSYSIAVIRVDESGGR
jgi:hypothetical protein